MSKWICFYIFEILLIVKKNNKINVNKETFPSQDKDAVLELLDKYVLQYQTEYSTEYSNNITFEGCLNPSKTVILRKNENAIYMTITKYEMNRYVQSRYDLR